MPAQCFIQPSIQRSPQYTVHAAQAHSALTWFSPPVEAVARGVAAEQSPATGSHGSYLKTSSYYLVVSSITGKFCFASVILSPQRKAIVGCIYNNPNSSVSDYSQLCEIFKLIPEAAFDVKIISADFNFLK
ncbi:hypothetical protein SprV_0100428100 [Sparganum proliferum]